MTLPLGHSLGYVSRDVSGVLLLVKMIKKRLFLTFTAVCASALFVAVVLWWNAQLSGVINTISEGNIPSVDIILLATFTMFVMCAANYLKTYVSGFACEIMTHDLRMGYARYFSSLPLSDIERLNVGEQLSKLQNEIAEVSKYINGNLFQLVNDSITFLVTITWLLFINTRLTLTVNLPVIIIMIYVFYSSKVISNATEHSQQARGQMNKYADTLLTLFPVIRLYDATHMMLGNYNKEVGEWKRQMTRAEKIRARLMSLSGLLSNIPLMLIFLIGGNMVINDVFTLGTLYIFINLSGNVSGVMMNMPGYIASFRQFSMNMKRLMPMILLDGEGQTA